MKRQRVDAYVCLEDYQEHKVTINIYMIVAK